MGGEQCGYAGVLEQAEIGGQQIVGDENSACRGQGAVGGFWQQAAQNLAFDVTQVGDASDQQGAPSGLQSRALGVDCTVPGKSGAFARSEAGRCGRVQFRVVTEYAVRGEHLGLLVQTALFSVGNGSVDVGSYGL